MSDTMFETLKEILISKLKVSPEQITPQATPEDAELDSLAMVELSMLFQQQLGMTISDDELAEAKTLGDITRMMQERSVTL